MCTSDALPSRSSHDLTTIACALIPPVGVPILLPSPRMGKSLILGFNNVADSSPRNQCGTCRNEKEVPSRYIMPGYYLPTNEDKFERCFAGGPMVAGWEVVEQYTIYAKKDFE